MTQGGSRVDELTDRARRTISARLSEEDGVAAGRLAEASSAVPALAPDGWQAQPLDGVLGMGGELVLGIDPGTATTGYGLVRQLPGSMAGMGAYEVVAFGVITTPPTDPMPLRLVTIHRELQGLIRQHRPSQAAVEQLFFGRNTTTAITVGQARGVALLAIGEAGLTVAEYTPMEVKHGTAGSGRADKLQMQRMVQTLLGLPSLPQPDDAADALALSLCHLRSARARVLGLR